MRRIVASQVASASRLHPTMLRNIFRWHISSCSSCRVSANVESPNSAVGVTTALKSFNLPLIDKCLFTNMNFSLLTFPHDKIPSLPDLQFAWLLLLMCAAPRCNYLPRSVAPPLTDEFARTHDKGVARCLADLLANDAPSAH